MKNNSTNFHQTIKAKAIRAGLDFSFLKQCFLLFILTCAGLIQVSAQTPPTLQWGVNYGSNSSDAARNIIPTSDGGYLIVGQVTANTADVVGSGYVGNSDGWVIKISATGAIVWKKAFGTAGYDIGIHQAIEVSDGYVLVGSQYFSGGVSIDKLWYAKVSKSNGAIIWSQLYSATYYSIGYTIVSTPDGGYLVGGAVYNNGEKALLLKTNSTGTITTTYTSNPAGGLWGRFISQIEKTPDSGYLLLGSYYDNSEPGCNPQSEVPDPYDVWLCKFSSTYVAQWSKNYGGTTSDVPKDVVIVPSGDIFVLGNTYCTGTITGPNNVGAGDWLMKTNSLGTIQNAIIVSVNLLDYVVKFDGLGLSCDNQLLLCGENGGLLGSSAQVKKMSTSFNTIWDFFTSPSTSIPKKAFDIASTSDNGYIVVGSYNSAAKSNDFYIAKLSPDPGCGGGGGDFCSKATTVTCGQYLSNQSTVSETNSISSYPCFGNSTFNGKDRVYKIVLSQTSDLQIGLEILTSGLDLDLFLLSNNCSTVTCLDTSATPNTANNKEGIVKSLAAGTYYIVVDCYDPSGAGTFNIDFACNELNCSSPTVLNCGTPYSSTTVGYTNNVSIYKQTPTLPDDVPNKKIDVNNAGPERLHKFTIAQQSTVTITLSGLSTGIDLEMFLLSTCSKNSCIAKSTNAAGQNEVITMQLSAGTYYVSVDGFRTAAGSYTLTIDCGGCPAPPNNFNCGFVKCYYSGTGSNLQYTFTSSQSIAAGYNWKITGNNLNVTGGTGASYTYTFALPGTYQVCFPYLLGNGCVEYCCINLCVANPFDCNAISPMFDATANAWKFTLSGSGFTDIQWRNDATGQSAGTGYQSSFIPVPNPCNSSVAQSVSAAYYDGTCYRVCCFRYYPCNPFNCGLITYSFDAAQSGYRFKLNSIGGFDPATISWTVDSPVTQALGNGSDQSNLLPLPVNCAEYWVSVRFKDGTGSWVICCIKIYVCNPFNCFDFSYNYVTASNGYQFILNQSGTSNISWTVDDAPGGALNIGNTNTSNIYPVPGTCVTRTITVRYFWNGRWYICCRKIWLCNPTQCTSEINSNWISGTQLNLSINNSYQNVEWKLNSGTLLGNGNTITVPSPGANATVCVFYRDASNVWRICCKNIGAPPNPGSDLTFDVEDNVCGGNNTIVQVPIRVKNFNNVTTFQMSVAIPNGSIAQLESIQGGGLPGTGDYQVISTTTGALLWYNSTPVTVPDNTVICTLNIRLLGNASDATTLDISGNPVPISAEQSIGGVFTAVIPVVVGGSVCIASSVSISGQILREDNVGIGNVSVNLSGSSTQSAITDNQGNYAFSSLAAGGNYVVTPEKDINDKNGVNGGDLVAIQRHILGTSPFTSPYKRIASDVNVSNSINGGDLVAIQRLILGLDPSLLLNKSWLFTDKKYVFPNPNSPWSPVYPQTLTYNNLASSVTDADFTGIKIADVNLSNSPGSLVDMGATDRLAEGLELVADMGDLQSNTLLIPLRVSRRFELESFQFSLQFDPTLLKFRSVVGSVLLPDFKADNMNLELTDKGYLAFVWAAPDGLPLQLGQDDVLLWLEFETVQKLVSDISLPAVLQVNSSITPALATTHGGQEQGISLRFNYNPPGVLRYFIAPNPFSERTSLHLFLPEAETMDISLFSITGSLLSSEKLTLAAGQHILPMGCSSCTVTQMLLYKIQTGSACYSGKVLFQKQ